MRGWWSSITWWSSWLASRSDGPFGLPQSPMGASGWIIVFVSFSAVVLQLHTTLAQGMLSVSVIDTALLTGLLFSPVGGGTAPIGKAVWVLAEAALDRPLWWMVQRPVGPPIS
jgi:hypothetical protein